MAGNIEYSIRLSSTNYNKEHRFGSSMTATITRTSSAGFPDDAIINVEASRINFSDIVVLSRNEPQLVLGDMFTTSGLPQQSNTSGAKITGRLDYISSDIMSLTSASYTMYIDGNYDTGQEYPPKAVNFKSGCTITLNVAYTDSGDYSTDDSGSAGDTNDGSAIPDEEMPTYYVSLSPSGTASPVNVIGLSSFASGKRFNVTSKKLKTGTNMYVVMEAHLRLPEPYNVYFRDSINTEWRKMQNPYRTSTYSPSNFPTYFEFKTENNEVPHLEGYFDIYFYDEVHDDENGWVGMQYMESDHRYWIGTEKSRGRFWNFKLTSNDRINPTVFTSGWQGLFKNTLPSPSESDNMQLYLQIALQSGIQLYYYDPTYYPPNDLGINIYDKYKKITNTGILITDELQFDNFIKNGFYIFAESTPPQCDELTVDVSGTINTVYKASWGKTIIEVSSCEPCVQPEAVLVNGTTSDLTIIEDKITLEWRRAADGVDNVISGYHIYCDTNNSTILNKISPDAIKYTIYTSLQSGITMMPTPPPNVSWYYKIVAFGVHETKYTSTYCAVSNKVTRANITKITNPTMVSVSNTLSNDNEIALMFSGMSDGTNNTIQTYEIEQSHSSDDETWSEWTHYATIEDKQFEYHDFEFDGEYSICHGAHARPTVQLLSNGTFTSTKDQLVDIFLVGGGGGSGFSPSRSIGGGGGGYTVTKFLVPLKANAKYKVEIGEGGIGGGSITNAISPGGDGKPTLFYEIQEDNNNNEAFTLKAYGGRGTRLSHGGDGGSGGAPGVNKEVFSTPCNGACDGNSTPTAQISSVVYGGQGQNFTTKAFMEIDGQLFASGGGAAGKSCYTLGGDLNAGAGVSIEGKDDLSSNAKPNTGCGAGGRRPSSGYTSDYSDGGNGGSGIIIIRPSSIHSIQVDVPNTVGDKYLYRIRCIGQAGSEFASEWITSVNAIRRDLNENAIYTDQDLIPKNTHVKALHINELQNRITKMFDFYTDDVDKFPFTSIVVNQSKIADWNIHINEILQNIQLLPLQHTLSNVIIQSVPCSNTITEIRNILNQKCFVEVSYYNNDMLMKNIEVQYGHPTTNFIPDTTPHNNDYEYIFTGWNTEQNADANNLALYAITQNTNLYASYYTHPQIFNVKFMNNDSIEYETYIPAGLSAIYKGEDPVKQGVSNTSKYKVQRWVPDVNAIHSDIETYPVFIRTDIPNTIEDTWEEIVESINDGTYVNKYRLGDTKQIDLGELGYVSMEIAGIHVDKTENDNEVAAITWISKHQLPSTVKSALVPFETSAIRSYLYDTLLPLLPEVVVNNLTPIIKDTQGVNILETLWLPSCDEIKTTSSLYGSASNLKYLVERLNVSGTVNYFLRDGYCIATVKQDISTTENERHPILCFCLGRVPFSMQ